MAEEDRAVSAALSTGGSLFDGCHPMLAELRQRNAERLNAIFDSVGWPGREIIGGACWAAMWVLQHAIGSPNVMRRGSGCCGQRSAAGRSIRCMWRCSKTGYSRW
jgi:hypothetical protein